MTTPHPSPAQHRALRAAAEGRLRHQSPVGVTRERWFVRSTLTSCTVRAPTVRRLLESGWITRPAGANAAAPGSVTVLLTPAGRAALDQAEADRS